MADHFTTSLCALKHNGAVDTTQQGFSALCERCVLTCGAGGEPGRVQTEYGGE